MKSNTNISLNLQMPNFSVVVYAVQGDVMSREVTASLYDGQTPFIPSVGALGTVRFLKPDGTSGFYDTLEDDETVAVTWEDNIVTIRLAEQVLTVPGDVIVQVSFYNADAERLSTFNFKVVVEKNPLTDEQFESTDYYSVLTARIAAVLGAVAHAPQINELNHWVLWDEEEQDYYDSGVEATGPQGPQGPQGEQGEPGRDGQGAPGSALPLMDGTASAGSQIVYSREDHRHPTDTSRASATDVAALEEKANTLVMQPKSYNVAHIGSISFEELQGSFNIGNTVYIYNMASKYIKPVNIETGAVGSPISVDFWHGNDFVAIDNTVYCAPYTDNSDNPSKLILKYTLNGSVTQLNPFSSISQDCLYAIDKIDNNTLICALRTFGNDAVNSSVFYKYEISTGNITQLTVDWNGVWLGQSSFPHPMVYTNGCLYLTASFENGYYTLALSDNTLKCVGYRSLPYSDAYGQSIAELEGICSIPLYGEKFLVMTSKSSFDSCLFFAVNVDGNTPNTMLKDGGIGGSPFLTVYVSELNESVFEIGSQSYPFKTIERATVYCNELLKYGVVPTIQLESDIATGDNSVIRIYCANLGFNMNGHTINRPITFNRGTYIVTGHVFAKTLTVRIGSKFNLLNETVLNDVTIDSSEFYEARICTHNGTVSVSGGIWFCGADPNENVVCSALQQTLIKINRTTKPANMSIGGGTTLLLAGTK